MLLRQRTQRAGPVGRHGLSRRMPAAWERGMKGIGDTLGTA